MHADTGAGGELGTDAGIGERDRIIARTRDLAAVVEARPIARTGLGGVAGIEPHRIAGLRHHQHVAEVGMAGAREVRVAEALDRRILVAVAGSMAVAGADLAAGVRVRR